MLNFIKKNLIALPASDGLYLENADGSKPLLIKNLSEYYKAWQRSNDVKADPKGRVWFGSSVDDDIHEASGNLFCMGQTGEYDGCLFTCKVDAKGLECDYCKVSGM